MQKKRKVGRPRKYATTHKYQQGDRQWTDPRYNTWRAAVRKRDNYRCVMCGFECVSRHAPAKSLICHHIRRWADQPTLRFAVSNGATLCRRCHKRVTGNEDAYAPLLILKVAQNAKAAKSKEDGKKGIIKDKDESGSKRTGKRIPRDT